MITYIYNIVNIKNIIYILDNIYIEESIIRGIKGKLST